MGLPPYALTRAPQGGDTCRPAEPDLAVSRLGRGLGEYGMAVF